MLGFRLFGCDLLPGKLNLSPEGENGEQYNRNRNKNNKIYTKRRTVPNMYTIFANVHAVYV